MQEKQQDRRMALRGTQKRGAAPVPSLKGWGWRDARTREVRGPRPRGRVHGRTGSTAENTSSAVSGKDHEEEKLDEETGHLL